MIRRLDVKIVFTLLVTTLIPLSISIYLVGEAVDTSLGVGLNPAISGQMERGLEIHRQYIEAVKGQQRLRLEQLADSSSLRAAVDTRDDAQVVASLERSLAADASLRELRLVGPGSYEVKAEALPPPDADEEKLVTRSVEVELGPYTSIEAVFGVDASLVESYTAAGKDAATYAALVRAPPSYLNRRVIFVYIAILGVIVAASIAVGVLWTRVLARRIHRLSAATAQVARGDLTVRVDPGSGDEVGELVESFNGMVAELGASRTRIEYLQKISAWQEMARRLAHEIKNPLTPIHLAAQQLREKYSGDDPAFARLLEQSTEIIEEEVATLRRLTSDFTAFARLPEVRPQLVDLREFLEECEQSLRHLGEQGVSVVWEIPTDPIPVLIDRMMMRRVIDNLTRNAAEALVGTEVAGPRIRISAARTGGQKHPEVELRVADNGPGIQPEHHPSIFDPYFTTKSEGTGLGLAICKKIVLEHGGRIWVDEGAAQGAVFVVVIPIAG
ncbi:MAG: ATP-binding protein [Proteobacteria bacterium]|jgi:nitrogen fixation/metabolism regulation signal transduction histidine kinase|nr:ATP-binding protein [Pseudomonadota bacterium]